VERSLYAGNLVDKPGRGVAQRRKVKKLTPTFGKDHACKKQGFEEIIKGNPQMVALKVNRGRFKGALTWLTVEKKNDAPEV